MPAYKRVVVSRSIHESRQKYLFRIARSFLSLFLLPNISTLFTSCQGKSSIAAIDNASLEFRPHLLRRAVSAVVFSRRQRILSYAVQGK